MDLSYAMRTTPATREFTDDPVPDDVLYDVLDDARFAPNGNNRQAWKVVIVRDPELRRRLGELYDLGGREVAANVEPGQVPFVAAHASATEVVKPGEPPTDTASFGQNFISAAPVVLVVLLDLTRVSAMDTGLRRLPISAGGSVYPFVQNVLLAARARGLGGVPTTPIARQEPALRELLGVPDNFVLASVVPLGHPLKTITKLRRAQVEEFAVLDRFDGEPLTR